MVQLKSSALASAKPFDTHRSFTFVEHRFDPLTGVVELVYKLDQFEFTERFTFPGAPFIQLQDQHAAIEAALDLLHWVAGISYWKTSCPGRFEFRVRRPDAWQADWLLRLYRRGLAEFAFENELNTDHFPIFPATNSTQKPASSGALERRSLVPMGGGKDSLVAWERLRHWGDPADSVQVGTAALIQALGEQLPGRHWVINRAVDPQLLELNHAGALNGHVPVTAINAAALTLAALLWRYDRVIFANERSANEATRIDHLGHQINHQFSKSFEFEAMFDDWVRRYIHRSLRVFSLLRQDRELSICKDFAQLRQWHHAFSSCNRNFHLDGPRTSRWCGQCPKCHFVYLCLAPFMSPSDLAAIFGQDLLGQSGQIEAFSELLALDGVKPFECVGEANEARAAVTALAEQSNWADHAVVQALNQRLRSIARKGNAPSLAELCQPGGDHRIPQDLIDAS